MKRITVKLLQELGACEDQIELSKKFLGKRKCVYATASTLKAAEEYGLNTDWATMEGLVSREVALTLPQTAFEYAFVVDKAPSDDTRVATLNDAKAAQWYAANVDKCPRDDTRNAALGDAEAAGRYAAYVDKSPRDDTRKAALGDPWTALYYAVNVDECPRDDTRNAVLGNAEAAWHYALYVDEGPRDATRAAAYLSPRYKQLYIDAFGE